MSTKEIAIDLFNKGNDHWKKGEYILGFESFKKAYTTFEKLGEFNHI